MGSGHWSVQSYTPISICTTRRHQGAPRGVGRRPKNHRPLQLLWLRFCRFSVRCDGLVRNYANRKIATQRYPKIPCIYNFLINGIIILISKATRRGRCIFFFFLFVIIICHANCFNCCLSGSGFFDLREPNRMFQLIQSQCEMCHSHVAH